MANTTNIFKLLNEFEHQPGLLPEKSNGFLLSLLALSAYIISADRIVMDSETEFVHDFLHEHFGEADEQEFYPLFKKMIFLFRKEQRQELKPKIQKCCTYIMNSLSTEDMPLVTLYLQQLAASDNATSAEEKEAVAELTEWLEKQQKS